MTSNSTSLTALEPARNVRLAFGWGLVFGVIFAVGCGGRDSAASRSAAEFDREQQKGGTAATGGAHGGHGAGQEPADDAEARDSEGMAGMDHANMPGMKPAGAAKTQGGAMAGMDHANMPGTTIAPPLPEKASVSAQPGQPAATLRPGDLDGAAPTSVRDAARSAELAQATAGGGHGMTHGTYSQTDAGRDATAPDAQSADPHRRHGQPAPPRPSPSPSAKENNE